MIHNQNGFILLRTEESMLFASPASRRAILAVALAVVSAPWRILMVAFISACVHALPLANLAAHAEASATVTIAFLTIQINLKRAILIEPNLHRFQHQSRWLGSPIGER